MITFTIIFTGILAQLTLEWTTQYVTSPKIQYAAEGLLPVCMYNLEVDGVEEVNTIKVKRTTQTCLERVCSCGDDCIIYNDCCLVTENKTNEIYDLQPHPLGMYSACLPYKFIYVDQEILNGSTLTETRRLSRYYFVAKCPAQHQSRRIKELCEDITLDDPDYFLDASQTPNTSVYYMRGPVNIEGVWFYNIFCAMCHGIKLTNIEAVMQNATQKIVVERYCHDLYTCESYLYRAHDLFNRAPCSDASVLDRRLFGWDEYLPHIDNTSVVDNCSNVTLEAQCRQYINYIGVFSGDRTRIVRVYKNGYCAMCNGEAMADMVCINTAFNRYNRPVDGHSIRVSQLIHSNQKPSAAIKPVTFTMVWSKNITSKETINELISEVLLLTHSIAVNFTSTESFMFSHPHDDAQLFIHVAQIMTVISRSLGINGLCITTVKNYMSCSGALHTKACTVISYLEARKAMTVDAFSIAVDMTKTNSVWYKCFTLENDQTRTLAPLDVLLTISLFTLVICIINNALVESVAQGHIINVCVALLVANVSLFLVRVNYSSHALCELVTAVAHTAWLSSFISQSILASTYLRIGQMQANENSRWSLVAKMAFSWIAPISIVVLAIIVGDTVPEVEYFSTSICWIKSQNSKLIFFILPIGSCLCLNITLLSVLLYRIQRMSFANAGYNSKSNTWLGVVVCKLSFIDFNGHIRHHY